MATIRFPSAVGSSTVFKPGGNKTVTIFMVDSTVPLFNVACGTLRFLADKAQTERQLEACELNGGVMPNPTWKWEFDDGFSQSLDGHNKKGWVLKDPA